MFDTVSLSAVMIGQKSAPRGYDAVVDTMSEEEIRKRLASMRATLENSVAVMPSHRVFIAENCASEDFAFRAPQSAPGVSRDAFNSHQDLSAFESIIFSR